MTKTIICGAFCAVLGAGSMTIWADDQPATAAPAAPAGPTAMSSPSMTFPLVANPNPLSLDAGPLGKVYITGAITGLGVTQNNAGSPICNSCDKSSIIDISNGQVFIQKTTGLVQFFVEGGGYSLPTIGQPYVRSGDATKDTFGIFPVGYLKLAPGNGSFSIEAGKLPSNESIGIASSAHAWGGALLVNYAVNSKFSAPARLEYLGSSGGTNLLYGPGSKAWSVTVTPTYQEKIFFARPELSYIAAESSTSGFAFGETGTSNSQAGAMIETGFIF